jgi:hypothetical protein
VAGFYEHGIELAGSIKCWECLGAWLLASQGLCSMELVRRHYGYSSVAKVRLGSLSWIYKYLLGLIIAL